MKLYLMRHAEAEPLSGSSSSDEERPLTAYGRFQAEAIAQELKTRKILPLIASSPFRRALETAQILCRILGLEPVRQESRLAATGRAPALTALLNTYPDAENLLLIGHQPDMGMLVEQVLGFELGFATATLAAFERRDPASWKFLWTRRPEDLMKGKN